MARAQPRFADRGMRVVAGYLEAGCTTLDALLDDARTLARERLPGGARSALRQLERRLDRHLRLEEHIVFPLLEEQGGSRRATASLRREHRRLRALVDDAGAVVERRDPQPFLQTTRALGERLRRHHRRERRILDALEA
ncbi:MAG TPA: hemerythrin domain-containing protein [Polyangia bacterium]